MTGLKLIRTLELLVTLSPVQTPNRGFASKPHWGLSSPSPWQYADRVRREKNTSPQLKSIVIMLSFALLAMLVSATFDRSTVKHAVMLTRPQPPRPRPRPRPQAPRPRPGPHTWRPSMFLLTSDVTVPVKRSVPSSRSSFSPFSRFHMMACSINHGWVFFCNGVICVVTPMTRLCIR